MRLELGVGDHPNIHGSDCIYVDLRDCGIRPLVVANVFAPLPFADGQFSHVASHHTLEHASWKFTDTILKEWVRVLRRGCSMHLEVPDFRWQAARILKDPNDLQAIIYAYGMHDMPSDLNTHRNGFTHPLLEKALRRAGLTSVMVRETGGCLVAEGLKE